MPSSRFLGIFVHPLDCQSEGLTQVFDNLQRVGATAIALTPRLAVPVTEGGVRFPDLHIDGQKRVLGRPVWGKYELQLKFYPAREPSWHLYEKSVYQPRHVHVPAELDREVPAKMIEEAHRRGMAAYLQLQPFLPPDLRRKHERVYVDGSQPTGKQIAAQACLNQPEARAYALAHIEDNLLHFPSCDGLFVDWTEFAASAPVGDRILENEPCP